MFQIQWLRRLIRRNTRKIPVAKAVDWKQRLSITYMILAWNAFGVAAYMCFTGRADWMRAGGYVPDVDIPPARSFAHTLGIKNAQVIRVSGLNVDTYEIKEEDKYMEALLSEHEKEVAREKESATELEE